MFGEENIYISLLHHPVLGKDGSTITSAVTNLDIHDLSRLCRTYGVKKLFIITPDEKQREICKRIIDHWVEGYGSVYNGDRREALANVELKSSLEDAVKSAAGDGDVPVLVATSAGKAGNSTSFSNLRDIIKANGRDTMILLGTSWGLADDVIQRADYLLEPIDMNKGYNHLSVRSAASIILDRLLN